MKMSYHRKTGNSLFCNFIKYWIKLNDKVDFQIIFTTPSTAASVNKKIKKQKLLHKHGVNDNVEA